MTETPNTTQGISNEQSPSGLYSLKYY
jgi:hypothetical protein